jgi:hypothetical protein
MISPTLFYNLYKMCAALVVPFCRAWSSLRPTMRALRQAETEWNSTTSDMSIDIPERFIVKVCRARRMCDNCVAKKEQIDVRVLTHTVHGSCDNARSTHRLTHGRHASMCGPDPLIPIRSWSCRSIAVVLLYLRLDICTCVYVFQSICQVQGMSARTKCLCFTDETLIYKGCP